MPDAEEGRTTKDQKMTAGDKAQNAELSLPDDVVLSVRNVSKKFCRDLRRSMLYGMQDLGRSLVGLQPARVSGPSSCSVVQASSGQVETPVLQPADAANPATRQPGNQSTDARLRKGEFWALRDVSFDLRRGEALGIIGSNGAGKTTLLRVLSEIFPPDAGEILRRGRIGALIALGAGFHPHMTGRENIYLNGTILGMARAEIEAKFDRIVAFAEVGEFIDAPIATYSSGMRVRLGFAIASHMDPDILLVDEVLSVGDASFRERCHGFMSDYLGRGGSIIFISHNTIAVEQVCDRSIWMDEGTVVMAGRAAEVIQAYEMAMQERSRQAKHVLAEAGISSSASGPVSVTGVEMLGSDGQARASISFGESFAVRIRYSMAVDAKPPALVVGIKHGTRRQDPFLTIMAMNWTNTVLSGKAGDGEATCVVENPNYAPGVYTVYVGALREVTNQTGEKWHVPLSLATTLMIEPGSLRDLYPGVPAAQLVNRIAPSVQAHRWTTQSGLREARAGEMAKR